MAFEVEKTHDEWKEILTEDEFEVLRNKGTERAGVGAYTSYYPKKGFFKCKACQNPLYSCKAKFDSGCGWPAFDKCFKGGVITEIDASKGRRRIEIMCFKCGGHLGHVFEGEGFTKTNERHCVNSISVTYDSGKYKGKEATVI